MTPEEQAQRRFNVEQAFHSTRLEGGEPSELSIQLSEQWIRDEITLDQWLQTIKRKYGIADDTENNN